MVAARDDLCAPRTALVDARPDPEPKQTLGAQPLEQPWGSYTNLWDLKVTDTPKTRGIDKIVASPPAPITAGWPAPLVRHNASFFVGYYSPNGLPPVTPAIAYNNVGAQYSYLGASARPLRLPSPPRVSHARRSPRSPQCASRSRARSAST